jgi:hypothetical protein
MDQDAEPLNAPAGSVRPFVFISHDGRDADLAVAFGKLLTQFTAGKVESFCSSDDRPGAGIDFGAEWYDALKTNMRRATHVVCLLTERSIERPWILFEAGMAKGDPGIPVHGVLVGVDEVKSGPFRQFQICDGSSDALCKLLLQLCRGVADLDQAVLRTRIHGFRRAADKALGVKTRPRGSTRWRRTIPLTPRLANGLVDRVGGLLDTVRQEAVHAFDGRSHHVSLDSVRANVLLPSCEYRDHSQFPGQLCFFAARPVDRYRKQELSNRFAPGEGVSGKVFLDGVPFAEDGRVGVSVKKLGVMHAALSAVAGFPLLDRRVRNAFGVVCIDFVGVDEVDDSDLKHLLAYEPVKIPIQDIAALLDPGRNQSFDLEFTARF